MATLGANDQDAIAPRANLTDELESLVARIRQYPPAIDAGGRSWSFKSQRRQLDQVGFQVSDPRRKTLLSRI